MSRGKYKRKRERAKNRTGEENAAPDLPVGKGIEAETENEPASQTDKKGSKQENPTVRDSKLKSRLPQWLRELFERSSFTDWMLMVFTFVLALTSIFQGWITRKQLGVMQNDERAWMTFDPYDPSAPKVAMGTVIEGNPIDYTLKFSNTGKTPAIRVRVQATLELVETGAHTPLELLDDPKRGWVLESGILVPNAIQSNVITRTKGSDPNAEPATATEILNIQSLKKHIVVFGRIEYLDIFHEKHWTQFCKYVTGLPTAECAQYNSVDDNRKAN